MSSTYPHAEISIKLIQEVYIDAKNPSAMTNNHTKYLVKDSPVHEVPINTGS